MDAEENHVEDGGEPDEERKPSVAPGIAHLLSFARRLANPRAEDPTASSDSEPERAAIPDRLGARLAELRARAHGRADNARDGHTRTANRPVRDLPIGAIRATKVENIRLDDSEAAYTALRDSLGLEGQLQPIVVVADERRTDRFHLVAGFRRFRAAAELGWATIKAVIYPAGTTDEELFFVNAVENAQRFKLSDYEIAARATLMSSRFGTSSAEYARRLGVSDSRVQNLVRFLERLPPDIIESWRNRDRLLTDHMLQKLSSMPPDEAREFWAGWKARHAKAASMSHDRSRPRRSESRPTGATLGRLWVAVKRNADLEERTRDLLLRVVEFCQGHVATVPDLFDPRGSPAFGNREARRSRPSAVPNEESAGALPLSQLRNLLDLPAQESNPDD